MPGESTYTRAYRAICEAYVNGDSKPLTTAQVDEALSCTRGLSFYPGTTIENVINKLSEWKLIISGHFYGSDGKRVVPLANPRPHKSSD